jgi:hypothetical protein
VTGSELVPFKEGAKLVVSAVQAVVGAYRQNSVISKRELALVRVNSEKAIALAKQSAVGDIARASIREIAETSRLIEDLNLYGPAAGHAFDHLDLLSRKLRDILDSTF